MLFFQSPKERLIQIQNFLNGLGVTELFIHLIRFTKSDRIFEEALNLAITILDGGNHEIQSQFLKLLKQDSKDSERFFSVLKERMEQSQLDLKNGNSVSTDDLFALKRGGASSNRYAFFIKMIFILIKVGLRIFQTSWQRRCTKRAR